MAQQIPVDEAAVAPFAIPDDPVHEIAPRLAYRRIAIVNVAFAGGTDPGGEWVLVDAGLTGTAGLIMRAAASRFGAGTPPTAIVLTHGHFDHVGALLPLVQQWDVPVYAHPLEHPYLNGQSSYPAPDPAAGGGMMSLVAPLYPRGPVDVSRWLRALPEDGSIPHMPGWCWIHTPGHAPGHVSFWREADRALIAGDAFITTAQESAYAVAVQAPELHGPPMYYTPEWDRAAVSVRRLAALEPELVVTGHGQAMHGPALRSALHQLAANFETVAVPRQGHYVRHPVRAEDHGAYR
jgi:glyoxylase-like metal-dependent hydrolase (beta-lactamase superfamily II)